MSVSPKSEFNGIVPLAQAYFLFFEVSSQIIAEKCSKQNAGVTKSTVGLMLKRWREAGIIEVKFQSRSSNNYFYRFNPQGLKGMKVSQFIYKWNTMSYAERMTFNSK